MSDYLSGRVWQSDLSGDLKPLAAALANCGSDDGTSIYPSIAYLAWKLGRSERAVQYGMEKLKKMGVIVILANGKGGRSKVPDYRLIEDALPKRERWQAPQTGHVKGATNDSKGCSLEQKRVQSTTERVKPIAPDQLVEQEVEQVVESAPKTGALEICPECDKPKQLCKGHYRKRSKKPWPSRQNQKFQRQERPVYVKEKPSRVTGEERGRTARERGAVLHDTSRVAPGILRILSSRPTD